MELLRVRKKLESDVNDLMSQLNAAQRGAQDVHKQQRRYHDQIKDLQAQIEDMRRERDEARESAINAERR